MIAFSRKNTVKCHCALLIIALAFVAGCNKFPYKLAPVHGTVTVDGKPLFQGKVRFAPIAKAESENPGKPAYGNIQSDGTYRMTTVEPNDGAVVGEHWVMVVNLEEELPEGVPEFSKLTLPEKVNVVGDKNNQIDIKISRELINKYREDDT